jgi:hypothetical protein
MTQEEAEPILVSEEESKILEQGNEPCLAAAVRFTTKPLSEGRKDAETGWRLAGRQRPVTGVWMKEPDARSHDRVTRVFVEGTAEQEKPVAHWLESTHGFTTKALVALMYSMVRGLSQKLRHRPKEEHVSAPSARLHLQSIGPLEEEEEAAVLEKVQEFEAWPQSLEVRQ